MKRPAKKHTYDDTLLVTVLILVLVGLILLTSTSAYNGRVKFHDSYYYLKKQGLATVLGMAGMLWIARIDYHRWIPLAVPGYLAAIGLSIAVMAFGKEYNGSKRWLSLGPFSFQPSEFAKVAVILFLAWLINRNVKKISKLRIMSGMMLSILPVVGLVGASNLSTAIIILGIAVTLIFVASPRYAQFIWMAVSGVGFWEFFSPWKAIGWSDLQSGAIRRSMKKDIRHCKDFMQLEVEDCLAGGWETVYKNWDSCRKHRMI